MARRAPPSQLIACFQKITNMPRLTKTHAPREAAHAREIHFGARARKDLAAEARPRLFGRPPAIRMVAPHRVLCGRSPGAAFSSPLGGIHPLCLLRSQRAPGHRAFHPFRAPHDGKVYDAQGKVLIELAREYRRVVSYDEVPVILRQAILAAEDKNFFSHSGVEYRALPRVVQKTAVRSLAEWWRGGGFRLLFPQGGSTLTQQLVRGYFLQDRTSLEAGDVLFREGLFPRLLSAGLGARATNKLLRKLEEVRLALWLEEEMRRRYGSKEQAKREIFARSASFPTWATAAMALQPPRSTTSANPCRAIRRRTRGRRRYSRGLPSRPESTPRSRATRGPGAAAMRSWP